PLLAAHCVTAAVAALAQAVGLAAGDSPLRAGRWRPSPLRAGRWRPSPLQAHRGLAASGRHLRAPPCSLPLCGRAAGGRYPRGLAAARHARRRRPCGGEALAGWS
ncbi:hypothetical protein BHM03_00056282, partial [Ensete ventricosum]